MTYVRSLSSSLLTVLCSCDAGDDSCSDRSSEPGWRIVGGSAPPDARLEAAILPVHVVAKLEGATIEQGCTATRIARGVALTAAHCLPARGQVVVGRFPEQEEASGCTWARPAQGVAHPELDVAVLSFDDDAEADSLPLLEEPLEAEQGVLLAGYGLREDLDAGELLAIEGWVTELDETHVRTRAEDGGACAGDSGGPLVVDTGDHEWVVAGVLSGGSISCRGVDEYVRVDVVGAWLEDKLAAHQLAAATR